MQKKYHLILCVWNSVLHPGAVFVYLSAGVSHVCQVCVLCVSGVCLMCLRCRTLAPFRLGAHPVVSLFAALAALPFHVDFTAALTSDQTDSNIRHPIT